MWRIGVDIGGTFTDVALLEETSGRIGVAKVPTTPEDLAKGVLSALEVAMSRHQVVPAEVGLLSHGTTVVTNAILQKSGARAALVTTRGFRDVLELRRSARAATTCCWRRLSSWMRPWSIPLWNASATRSMRQPRKSSDSCIAALEAGGALSLTSRGPRQSK